MFGLPSTIPTDNLYKFMALSGLILAVFMLIYPDSQMDDLHRRIVEETARADALGVEIKLLNSRRERLITSQERQLKLLDDYSPAYAALKDSITTGKPFAGSKEDALKLIDERDVQLKGVNEGWDKLYKVQEQLDDEFKELQIKSFQLTGTSKTMNRMSERLDRLIFISIFMTVLGATISIGGFILWYIKVQQPTDKLLQTNLIQARRAPRRTNNR